MRNDRSLLIFSTPCAHRAARASRAAALNQATPIHLAATALRRCATATASTPPVDDVMLGCVEPVGEQGADIARVAALYADYAITAPGVTISRFCASGLEACNQAAAQVMSGQADLVVGGGVESMSACRCSPRGRLADRPAGGGEDRLRAAGHLGRPDRHQVGHSRADVDAYALESQRRAKRPGMKAASRSPSCR
jgi:acetyl-CoA C-acetyltransferase